jgi:hypothetical protein
MASLRSIPDDEGPNSASAEGTEGSAAGTYIHSVISMFPSLLPPIDDFSYDSHAARTTLINPYPPSIAERIRTTKAFATGKLRVYAVPDDSADKIRLKPGDTTQLPRLDVWLQLMGRNDVVDHSGDMKGVTGSLFIPSIDVRAKSNNQAELKIRLDSGPSAGAEFETIYVDPSFDTMHDWAEGGEERELMSYWAGKIVLPPDMPETELSALAQAMESSGCKPATSQSVLERPPSLGPDAGSRRAS